MLKSAKNYKKIIRKSVVDYKRNMRKQIRSMRSNSPKEYWNYINSLNKKTKSSITNLQAFFDYFKELNTNNVDETENVQQSLGYLAWFSARKHLHNKLKAHHGCPIGK